MQLQDKLFAVVDFFDLKGVHTLRPKLGDAIEALYLNEDSNVDDEEGISVGDDLREVWRRKNQLEKILERFETDICWLHEQIERLERESKAANR
jgi:hypothetical protein